MCAHNTSQRVFQQLCPGSESISKSGLLRFHNQLGEDNEKIVLSKKTVVKMEKGSQADLAELRLSLLIIFRVRS